MNDMQPLRVGILTFLHNDNYGSTLQAYALQRTLRKMGAVVEHLDYIPSPLEKVKNLIRSGNSPRLLLDSLRRLGVKRGQQGAQEKAAQFRAFYGEHMRLSPPCATERALAAQAGQYDCLVAGSDQIWSPTWINRVYFLPFASGAIRKVAYAPSLGVNRVVKKGKARRMAQWLRSFDRLSVREAQGAAILQQLLQVRPPVMPDPVMLLSRAEWLDFSEKPQVSGPYMLCYFIGDAPRYWEQVERMAMEQGLQPVVIPVTEEAYAAPYPTLQGLSPQAWVGAIEGAALVCTDSFHGASFAAMLGRPFSVILRDDPADPASRNSRLDQLFQRLGITPGVQPDWEQVQLKHQQLALEGKQYLREAVWGLAEESASPEDEQGQAAADP